MKIQKLTLSAFASIALLSSYASAEEAVLDPVVISADFRTTNLSQTSNSVTVLTTEEIADKASAPFEEVVGKIPNVNFSTGASRAHYIQIRGIGERSQFQSPINPSVGLIVDDIDVSESALALTMFDVKQIEVLKGPQGTTFGSNGMAGVVTLTSNEPTKETEGIFEATVGNYNTKSMGFAVGGSIDEKLQARISAYKNTSDGFMKNTYLDREDTQNIDELTTKLQLKYLESDNHTIDVNIMHLDVDNGYDAFTFDNSFNTLADEPGTDAQQTDAISLKSTYQIDNKMHLISKASVSKTDSTYSYDEDWTYSTYHSWGYTSFDEYKRDKEKKDIDLKLVSDVDGKILESTTDWTIGVYYKKQNEDLIVNSTWDPQYTSSFETEKKAVYGQLDTALSKKLTLITGLRIEKWKTDFTDSDNLTVNTDETLIGGKVGLSYQKADNDMYYVTLSKGYKPGGVNADSTLSSNQKKFETESLWNLDIGNNFSNLDNTIITRLNAFYGKRKDQQVKSSISTLLAGGGTSWVDYFSNAAEGTYYGLEVQNDYYPNDELHLFTSVGLLKSKLDEYIDPSSSIDISGRAPAHSPKYQYNIGFNYLLADNVQFTANIEGKDAFYFSNRHNEMAESYNLINSSITYEDKDWVYTFWGKNLTDTSYVTRGFGSFGNNPANGYITEEYTQQGAPRTFGITAKYTF